MVCHYIKYISLRHTVFSVNGSFMNYAGKIGQMVFVFAVADDIPSHLVKHEEVPSSMCFKSLIYNHKNTERKVCFPAENLENRKICINTHTHTQYLMYFTEIARVVTPFFMKCSTLFCMRVFPAIGNGVRYFTHSIRYSQMII